MSSRKEHVSYGIGYDDSITRWWTTAVHRRPFESPQATFDAPVNMGEAYVQIVYPVRKAFLDQYDPDTRRMPKGPFDHIYFPFENNRVDFTTFIHTPHHIWVDAITWLDVPESGSYTFDVHTCGSVALWVNGTRTLTFSPFTRNIASKTTIQLPLNRGMNELVVHADELAERDVFFYFEFRYKGSIPLQGVLLVDKGARRISEIETFLRSCFFPRDCLSEGNIELHYDPSTLSGTLDLTIDSRTQGFPPLQDPVSHVVARPDTDFVSLGPVGNDVGVFKLLVGAMAGGQLVNRELIIGLRPTDATDIVPMPTVGQRKAQTLWFIRDHGEEVVNRAMAICEVDKKFTPEAERFVLASLHMIEEMGDCADFHLVPMFLLITRYDTFLPRPLHDRIQCAIAKFRYWIDEPGNDVMWYFSENHAFLFHIAQYLAGHLFPETIFSASGRTGAEQYRIGKERVERWFDTFFTYGYAEWNSATYIPIDLIGFFVLFEVAPDQTIRDMSKRALDQTFRIMTYNSFKGIMSSSFGRAYEDTLKLRDQVEPCFMEWVAYGMGFVNSHIRAVSLFCISSYEPPRYDRDILCDDGQWMETELDQGQNQVKTYAFRTKDYFTASVRRFKPYQHGHQQHLMNVALGPDGVQLFVNHPGERAFSGGNRPSYWAGNGTMPFIEQYQALTMMLFRTDPEELVHYIHAYTTLYLYDEFVIHDRWLFIKVKDAYCGLWFSNGFAITESGANTGKEVMSQGLEHGVVVRCGNRYAFDSFGIFIRSLAGRAIRYVPDDGLTFDDPQYGIFHVVETSAAIDGYPIPYGPAKTMTIHKGVLEHV